MISGSWTGQQDPWLQCKFTGWRAPSQVDPCPGGDCVDGVDGVDGGDGGEGECDYLNPQDFEIPGELEE